MKIIGNENNKERLFHWFITFRCNYRCEYCIEHEKRSYDDRYLETAKVIRDVILPIYKPNKIEILGGEISLLKDLPDVLSEFNPNNYGFMHFITNGSNLDWFLPIKDRNHQVTVSIHESQREIDDIKKEVEKYIDKGLKLSLTTVLTNYNSEAVKYMKKVMPKGICVMQDQRDYINCLDKSLITTLVKDDTNDLATTNYIGKPCKCKSNLIHINHMGVLAPCNYTRYPMLTKHIVEYTKEEIEKAINNAINNPIINCNHACFPCNPSMVQYFEE